MSADRSSRRYVTVEEVYRRYGRDLLRWLSGALPYLNHQDCEDLLHQAVLKAVGRSEQYDPSRGSLRLWVFGILRNEVRMDLRRRRSREVGSLEGEVPADELSVESQALSRETLLAVEDALAELPFKEREALLAKVRSEGVANDREIGARLGLSPGSVAVYRQRAREKVRKALERAALASRGEEWSIRSPHRRLRA